MSEEEKTAVINERKRLSITPKKKKQPGKHKHDSRKASSLKSKKTALKKLNRKISAAKTKLKEKKVRFASDLSSDNDLEPQTNAGDQFGGRQKKKKKKRGGKDTP